MILNPSRAVRLTVVAFALATASSPVFASMFTGLGDVPHETGGASRSEALGISDDGSTVVGRSIQTTTDESFVWTESSGIIGLGLTNEPGFDPPSTRGDNGARGVSADGQVVVGSAISPGGTEAYRWTESTGKVPLGTLPGAGFLSIAKDVSADGSIVVGVDASTSLDIQAVRWTESTGLVLLVPGIEPGTLTTDAVGISADGSVVVGHGRGSSFPSTFPGSREAFRWTASDGIVALGKLEKSGTSSLSDLTLNFS